MLHLANCKKKVPEVCQQLLEAEKLDVEAVKAAEAISNRISAQWSFEVQVRDPLMALAQLTSLPIPLCCYLML